MPISFDTPTEEITKALISTYENKLRNMCTIAYDELSTLFTIKKVRKFRYLHVNIVPFSWYCDDKSGCDLVFDLKYNVPVIYAEITSQCESVLYYCSYKSEYEIKYKRKHEEIPVRYHNKFYFIECTYLKENELFKTVGLNNHYNFDMINTYKRYIELRGE